MARKRPATIAGALARAHKVAPQLNAMAAVLLPCAPRVVGCSSNLKNGDGDSNSHQQPLDQALKHQWASFNNGW